MSHFTFLNEANFRLPVWLLKRHVTLHWWTDTTQVQLIGHKRIAFCLDTLEVQLNREMYFKDGQCKGTLTNPATSIRPVGLVTALAEHYSSWTSLCKGLPPPTLLPFSSATLSCACHKTTNICKIEVSTVSNYSRDPTEITTEKVIYHHAKYGSNETALTVASAWIISPL